MSSDLVWLLAGGFAAAFASGLAGFAFALVASGVWYHLLPPQEAAPLVVAGSLLIQMLTLLSLRRIIQWRLLRPFLLGGAIGTPFGTWVLANADARIITFGVGCLMIAYAAWMLARIAMRLAPPRISAGRAADGAVGLAGGVLGGLGGFSGVLPTIWCDLRGWPKDMARGVYQPYIVAMQAFATATLAAGGFFSGSTGLNLLLVLPALLLGGWLGVRLYSASTAERFRLVLLVMLLASGVSLVV